MFKYRINEMIDWLKAHDLVESVSFSSEKDYVINNLSDNSKEIEPNTLFFCKGNAFRKEYLEEALSKGVVTYITDKKELLGYGDCIYVKDIRRSIAVISGKFYQESWKKLVLIGITGTKGKSTTAYMVKSIIDDHLKDTDKKCAILSSIENDDGATKEESHLTTLEPLQLHRKFYDILKNDCSHCVMEVSSQALKYDRVFGLEFDITAFLNIGEDHISDIEHRSFEDYYESKLKIFDHSKKVVVSDTLNIKRENVIYFGSYTDEENAEKTTGVRHDLQPFFRIRSYPYSKEFYVDDIGDLSIKMPGYFNIENAAAASIICHQIGIPYLNIRNGLQSVFVSGRMEMFRSGSTDNIAIVDYAHNKLSYGSLFRSIQEFKDYKVITIFGCPGKKALQRRQELAQIAERYSDHIYITEEDPGEEPLDKICDEIYSHIRNKEIAEIELDREKAIQKSFLRFQEPTLVLILGKGRESTQKRGKEYITTLSDVDLVQKYIL
ncbi:MAG: UDP-N-acetylmuramoyl-L-alanyl-D-glutamate--2,6-diaminopimelate ligase [Peptostreptococcaceae bacterium]|nr:UDP-N-acetylmuramoyl-L-alanyl-D-glutamate--2,6-diaminopimelate ligase [Peptostreptococcaceae bacterium]